MTLFATLDTLLLGPLKLLFETIFSLVNRLGSPGLSIVALSLIVNILVLPLYRRADLIQAEAIETEKRLRPGREMISRAFSGDERFMMLQTFYRQNHYSPLSSLKGILPLALEIPFFIAAYQFLSGLELLRGTSFGPIRDLSLPDGLLQVGGVTVNLLPVLMTVINLISSMVYTKDAPLKSRIQLYLMAAVFLVLLYGSPAGLTLYWTLNNLFSLLKNILTKNDRNRKFLAVFLSVAGFALLAGSLVMGFSAKRIVFCVLAAVILQVPLLQLLRKNRKRAPGALLFLEKKPRPAVFFLSGMVPAALVGLLIPSAVLAASPSEFVDTSLALNPTWYVISAFLYALGFFVFWPGIYYLLGSSRMKKGLELALWVLAGTMLFQYMVMKPERGNLSSLLQYDIVPAVSAGGALLNTGILLAVGIVLALLMLKKETAVWIACVTATLALGGMGIRNLWISQETIRESISLQQAKLGEKVNIPLSREGKNVVIFMLDRAIGSYPAVIFSEKPELKEKFDGFTWYENTLSHGGHTVYGTPGIFGGYDYVPSEMCRRSDELMKDKHNEALLVLPTLFSQEGYEVSVCSPPYAGTYSFESDLSLYRDIPNCHASDATLWFRSGFSSEERLLLLKRNFFCYSLCEASPLAAYGTLYNMGLYNQLGAALQQVQVASGISEAEGMTSSTVTEYKIMKSLSDITEISTAPQGTLTLLDSSLTHEVSLLKTPDYTPDVHVDNKAYDALYPDRFSAWKLPLRLNAVEQMQHYHVNMAAFLLLADWFDDLRENDLYDNTRIILVSDHGNPLNQLPDGILPPVKEDIMQYAPLLMVKDFDQHGEPQVSDDFMTNADVPHLAVTDLLSCQNNPFTGSPLDGTEIKKNPQYVIVDHETSPWLYREKTTFSPARWYTVRNNVYDLSAWTYLGVQ